MITSSSCSGSPEALQGAFGPFSDGTYRLSDPDIRLALSGSAGPLARRRRDWHAVEEVECWRGYVRADYLLACEQSLCIIEIKSDCDSLRRLDEQVRVYNSVADHVVLVVGWALAAPALRAIPWWWEVWLAEKPPAGETRLIPLRDGAGNPSVEASGLTSMLPVDELSRIALEAGIRVAKVRSDELRRVLSTNISSGVLRVAVYDWLVRSSRQPERNPA